MDTTRRIQRIKTRIKRNHQRTEKMRQDRLRMPFSMFVALMPYMTSESIQSLVLIEPPTTFNRKQIPKDLQLETFGMLTRLQTAPKDNDYLKTCCALVSVFTGMAPERVASRPAIEVLGIVNMLQREMERIGKLFQSLNSDKSAEEVNAGIDKLNFGAFGIADWYAKRMGIVDHEEVFAIPWARIYQCMKIDFENNEFEKRYRKIIEQRSKRK